MDEEDGSPCKGTEDVESVEAEVVSTSTSKQRPKIGSTMIKDEETLKPIKQNVEIARDINYKVSNKKCKLSRELDHEEAMWVEDWNNDPTVSNRPELAIGVMPRRLTDVKSSGARKAFDRAVPRMTQFMKMMTLPDNEERDRPHLAMGIITIDQLAPNPANNPGFRPNYANRFRKDSDPIKISLLTTTMYSGLVITETLKKFANEEWTLPCQEPVGCKRILLDPEHLYLELYGKRKMNSTPNVIATNTVKRQIKKEELEDNVPLAKMVREEKTGTNLGVFVPVPNVSRTSKPPPRSVKKEADARTSSTTPQEEGDEDDIPLAQLGRGRKASSTAGTPKEARHPKKSKGGSTTKKTTSNPGGSRSNKRKRSSSTPNSTPKKTRRAMVVLRMQLLAGVTKSKSAQKAVHQELVPVLA
jgi:hypothetical protein